MNKFGLESFLALAAKTPWDQPSDAIFVLVHWQLSSSKDFRCVGIGDKFGESESDPSELLPDGWNKRAKDEDGALYVLKYRQHGTGQKYVIKMVHSVGSTWQILLCREGDDRQASVTVDVHNEVEDAPGYPFKNIDKVRLIMGSL